MVDLEQFHRVFFQWTNCIVCKIQEIAAIDGKTVRRSHKEASRLRPIHVASEWVNEAGMGMGQLCVDEKTNEIKAIPELLKVLCLEGCIVTIDAMGTQKEIAKAIINKKAGYILQVKGKQQVLQGDLSLYFKEGVFHRDRKELVAVALGHKDRNGVEVCL